MGATYTVVIDEGGIARTYTRIESKKGSGDSIQWIAINNRSWDVRFQNGGGPHDNGSPLEGGELRFRVNGNVKKKIDAAKYPATGGKPIHYKYDILSTAGELMDDPDILLET